MPKTGSVAFLLVMLTLCIPAARAAESPAGLTLAIGYYGDRIRIPGLTAELELLLASGGLSTFLLDIRAGGVVSLRNDISAFSDVSLCYRMTFGFGLFWEASIGTGILWRFPLYVGYTGGSSPAEIPATGELYGSVPLGLGVGWDLSKNGLPPIQTFFRMELMGRYPDRGTILASYAVHAGVRIVLSPWGRNQ